MESIPVTQARQNIYKLIDEIISNSEPLQITSKKGSVIVISEEDWRAIQETMHLLSVPGMREALTEGANTPVEECKTLEKIGWDIE